MSAELILNLINEVLDSSLKLDERIMKEQAGSMTLTYNAIPEIPLSEIGWSQLETREGGEIPSEQRKQLQDFLSRIPGNDIAEKMQELNKFFEGDETYLRQQGFIGEGGGASAAANIISYLTFYKTLTTIVTHFNAASAGFSFESFLAVLLNGYQVPTNSQTIADLVSRLGGKETPISLKLYKEGQLEAGGSFTDLCNDLVSKGEMQYVCVTKALQGKGLEQKGQLEFYRFNFNLDNVFNIISKSSGPESTTSVLLPKTFIESGGKNVEELPTKKLELPSPEEVESTFVDALTKRFESNKEEIEAQLGPVNLEQILQVLDYANNEDLVKGERGKGTIKTTTINNALHPLFSNKVKNKSAMSKTELGLAIIKANDEDVRKTYARTELSALRQTQINNLYFYEKDIKTLIKNSVDFYNQADEATKKKALTVSKGYVDTNHFKLNQNAIVNIDKLAQPTPGNLFPEGQSKSKIEGATINIGVDNVKKMLDRVTGELNEIVFEIFSSLKSLTQQLQSYFAGGLRNDQEAISAREAALNIEKKTAETQAQAKAERAAETAKAQRVSATRRQARASQPAMGLDRPLEESKEFDDQLKLLMKEVFGR